MLRLNFSFFLIIQLYSLLFCLTSGDTIDPEWDLPTEQDLYKYLSAVKDVTVFSSEYKDETDINAAFGLYLANINLGHALKKKHQTMPKSLRHRIQYIIDENNEILNEYIFKESSVEEKDLEDDRKRLLSLFNNESYWIEGLEKFVYTMEKRLTPAELREIYYSPFSLHMKKVDNYYKGIPSPADSDECLISLAKNPINMKRSSSQCSVKDFCYDMLKRGTDFGYSLTHRIVLLLMARYGRGCSILSEQNDRALVKQLCSMAHSEATYIAENNYGLVDLFMEIIALCTADGHSQFLRRTWLDNMLNFQTPDGCFGAIPVKKVTSIGRSFFTTKIGKYNHILLEGCSVHTTGLAAATFAAAVRFIIEEYY